ncbi:MAG: HD domain-containing phosphohydrolase [Vicinamibacteraceae bacterium]
MAALEWTVVQSRVGRRVAALLALSGLAPLLILAGVTSWMVSGYLLRQEQNRLRVLAKESAMAAFERLLEVEDRLRVIGAQPAASIAPTSLRGVAALARLDRQGRTVTVFGQLDPPALDDADRARLAAGGAVVRMPTQGRGPIHLVVPASGVARYDVTVVIAALEPRALWALDDQASDGTMARELCAAAGTMVMACTDERLDRAALAQLTAGTSGAGTFEARRQDGDWMGAYWSAPIRTQFGAAQWTSIVVTRTADAVAPAQALIRTVVLVVVATICVVLLVSLYQIRRLLDPIARLQAGTASLARGEFGARVDVRTGDELQALSESFNAMAADLQGQFEQLHALSVGTLEALARTIDAKSPWTAGHSTRVAEVTLAIGRGMQFDSPSLERLRRGALLHDIGKIGVSADILDSPLPLTDEQRGIVEQHPALGARILEPLPHCADIVPMVLQHHERFDGAGYPAGLAGAAIALDARVLAVADVYDAMTSDRPYRRGLPPCDAAIRITEAAGTQFDPDVVAAFTEAFRSRRIPVSPPEAQLEKSA